MKKSTIRLIIFLMSLSLIGLVAFQLYWIKNAIQQNVARFKQDAHEALNAVADKLEKQEALVVTFSKLQSKNLISPDSTTYQYRRKVDNVIGRNLLGVPERPLSDIPPVINFKFENNEFDFNYSPEKLGSEGFFDADQLKDFEFEFKYLRKNNDSLTPSSEKLNQRIAQKSEIVSLVLRELITGEKMIKDRIDKKELDSLLENELRNKGIDIDFNYGVVQRQSDSVLFANTEVQNYGLLRQSDLKVSLFPNDIIGDVNFLAVHFPGQNQFLLSKIWFSLASSVVLILIIVGCFSYAILTIIRQKKLSEIKNDFINNMTHEFKTPISTVSLACEALLDKDISNDHNIRERYIGIIKDENKRLGLQVEKVLQIATLEKKDFKLKREQLNVHDIVHKVTYGIQIQVEKREGAIQTFLDAHNPNVHADEVHLSNILYNLLDNAIKYSPNAPIISVATSNNEDGVYIKVKDKGMGMSNQTLNKIFEKFYRVPTGNVHDVKGFGLGLTYVKMMVEAHDGIITVKSELKKGSTFEIYIPYGKD